MGRGLCQAQPFRPIFDLHAEVWKTSRALGDSRVVRHRTLVPVGLVGLGQPDHPCGRGFKIRDMDGIPERWAEATAQRNGIRQWLFRVLHNVHLRGCGTSLSLYHKTIK